MNDEQISKLHLEWARECWKNLGRNPKHEGQIQDLGRVPYFAAAETMRDHYEKQIADLVEALEEYEDCPVHNGVRSNYAASRALSKHRESNDE